MFLIHEFINDFVFFAPLSLPPVHFPGILYPLVVLRLSSGGRRVMEKYSRARGATASFLWLSGLGHVQSKTMKDKAVSNGSLAQLRLSFISPVSLGHTPDRSSPI